MEMSTDSFTYASVSSLVAAVLLAHARACEPDEFASRKSSLLLELERVLDHLPSIRKASDQDLADIVRIRKMLHDPKVQAFADQIHASSDGLLQ